MMKHLYVENQKPSNIYTEVDGKAKKWRKAWIATSSNNYTKVWDISGNEYLKVYESYIGQKFLERYYTQSVYTSVYWVHEVDGQEVETYISSSEFNSWECETLEPYYYTDNSRQYVGYYQLPVGTGFGQHDMKITYKSPDTNEILEVEYPIYYLEEVALINNQSEPFNWYPFRDLFGYGESLLPVSYFSLFYQCYDKKGNLITATSPFQATILNTKFTFQDVPGNAHYYFKDNQAVDVSVFSPCRNFYDTTIYVNAKKYYDESNMTTTIDNCTSNVMAKQLAPFVISLNLQSSKNLYFTENYTDLVSFAIGTIDDGHSVAKIVNKLKQTVYENVDDLLADGVCEYVAHEVASVTIPNLTILNCYFNNEENRYKGASFGYIYWGDGTFSRFCPSAYFQGGTISSAETLTNFSEVKLKNGMEKIGDDFMTCYDDSMFQNSHIYEDFGEYEIEITNAFGCKAITTNISMTVLTGISGFENSINRQLYVSDNILNIATNRLAYDIVGLSTGDSCCYGFYNNFSTHRFYNSTSSDKITASTSSVCFADESFNGLYNLEKLILSKRIGSLRPATASSLENTYALRCANKLTEITFDSTMFRFNNLNTNEYIGYGKQLLFDSKIKVVHCTNSDITM